MKTFELIHLQQWALCVPKENGHKRCNNWQLSAVCLCSKAKATWEGRFVAHEGRWHLVTVTEGRCLTRPELVRWHSGVSKTRGKQTPTNLEQALGGLTQISCGKTINTHQTTWTVFVPFRGKVLPQPLRMFSYHKAWRKGGKCTLQWLIYKGFFHYLCWGLVSLLVPFLTFEFDPICKEDGVII